MQRRYFLLAGSALALPPAFAHHGWSSFDQDRPLYIEGRAARVSWRNPHVELDVEVDPGMKLPADLRGRAVPAQSASVDGPKVMGNAQLPTRRDRVWHVELAPLTRVEAWQLAEIKPGDQVALVGYTFSGEKGDAVLRAEYVFVGGKAYGMRSSPA
jgi:Family of unknown function (DUF6152)